MTWTQLGTAVTISMTSTVYVGLAVTSHADGTLCTAEFTNVTTSLPPPWETQDIGAVAATGTAAYAPDGTFTLEGSGAEIWYAANEFRFAYETLSGDGNIVARVASVENTNEWAKAGVMIRETLAAGSKNAFVALQSNHLRSHLSAPRAPRTGRLRP